MDMRLNVGGDENTLELKVTQDDKSVVLRLSTISVDALVRALIAQRACMVPAHPQEDPGRDTVMLAQEPMRAWLGADVLPTQARLGILHPGLGWVVAPLRRGGLEVIGRAVQRALEAMPRLQ